MFCDYWAHWENRVSMSYVFEELAFLAPAWCATGNAVEISCDNTEVDVIAKSLPTSDNRKKHFYIVAAIQNYTGGKATFKVSELAENGRQALLVLRENRVVPVNPDGTFTDTFDRLGVHVYSSLQVLPSLKTLTEIQAEIDAPLARAKTEGNLLASDDMRWRLATTPWFGTPKLELFDGIVDARGWSAASPAQKDCEIIFEKPVTFSSVVVYSPTIRDAELQIREGDDDPWRTIHQWKDQLLYRFEYQGKPVTAGAMRIHATANRDSFGWVLCEITELGIYK